MKPQARPTTDVLFTRLLERAGTGYAAVAKLAGYSHPSGLQRWALPGASPMPASVVRKVMPHLIGKGDPPISAADVLELGDPEDLLVTACELKLLLWLRSRDDPAAATRGLVAALTGGGEPERPQDRRQPPTYAPTPVETERVVARRKFGGAGD